MLKTIAAAIVAASLIAGPALAQGNSVSPAPQTKAATTAVKPAKQIKAPRHVAKVVKHRHYVRHVKRVHSAKPAMHRHKHIAKQGKYLRIN